MIDKSTFLLIGFFGSIAIFLAFVFRRDPVHLAQSGPAWRRRLFTAGITLLSLIGFGAFTGCRDDAEDAKSPDEVMYSLDKTNPSFSYIEKLWKDASAVASGERGNYPFNENGKKDLLQALFDARTIIDSLVSKDSISSSGAQLLKNEFSYLTKEVGKYRPVEMKEAACYEPMAYTPFESSLERLQERLPYLQQFVANDTLHPEVASKIVQQIEKDLAILEESADQEKLPEMYKQVKTLTAQIKAKLSSNGSNGGSEMGEQEFEQEWQQVEQLMHEAEEIVSRKRGLFPFNRKEKEQLIADLEALLPKFDSFANEEKIAEASAELLKHQVRTLIGNVQGVRPIELEKATCYKPVMYAPRQKSLKRLQQRLPMLQQLAETETVQPAVVEKALAKIEEDLQVLSGNEGKALTPDEKEQAENVSKEIKKTIEIIRQKNAEK